jgi:hypothetical protein
MSSFTDDLWNALHEKKVWVFFYSKGGDVSIFYNRTAAKMIVGCMNHSALHGIHATEITFAKVLLFNGEPRLAKLSADMIRDAHAAALPKN